MLYIWSDFDEAGEQSVTGSVQVGSSGTGAKLREVLKTTVI